jgi:flavin reductase (DIM6/NTAB) family NADH-FMN oxidoreductase RutF
MDTRIAPVPLEKAYRLINHGPTVLVSSRYDGVSNVMAAAWACALDYKPPKVTVVVAQGTKTRELIEKRGAFVIQVPTAAQVQMIHELGTHSWFDEHDKVQRAGATLFEMTGSDLPFVEGCSAWLACEVVPEPYMQETYDLFVGEVRAAWADERAFKEGHWQFERADPAWRSLHHIAGGHFYAIGEALTAKTLTTEKRS